MRLMEMLDRKRGALIGLAIGDALGAPIDLELPGDFPAITGFRGGGRNDLKPGEWANHTSMALALADSIATAGWDLNDQARRYVAWWREGKYTVRGRSFHVSAIMQQSLKRFLDTGYALASGDRAEESSSSGPLTRLAPVVIRYAEFFPRRPENMIWLAIDSSLPTHASPQCLSACAYLSLVLCGLVHGIDRETVLSPHWEPLRKLNEVHALHSEVAEVAAGSFRCERCPSIVGSAYVVKSLEAALWAFHDAGEFRQAVLRAVNLGDDADAVGAICGQLAGAWWGESGIPVDWRQSLARFDMLDQALQPLLKDPIS